MKKLFFLLAILLLPSNTTAMFFQWYEYKDVYIFGIQLLRNKELQKLIYNYPYNDDGCMPGNEKNIAEWQQRYPQVKQDSFFHQFIYRASFRKAESVLIAIKTKEKNPVAENPVAQVLYKRKDIKALEYLVFAKRCEPLATSAAYGWEDGDEPKTSFNKPDKVEDLIALGLKKIKETKDAFLRQRYVFQVVRLAYRTGETEKAIEYFDKFADHKNKTYMYYRALIHKGFALQKLEKDSEANKIFAEIFSNSPDLRCFAYRSFSQAFYLDRYREENTKEDSIKTKAAKENWEKSIATEKNKDILQMLCVLRAASLFDLQPAVLSAAYKANADLSVLEMLAIKQLKVAETQLFLPSLRKTITFDTTKLLYGQNYVNLASYQVHTNLSKKEKEEEIIPNVAEEVKPVLKTKEVEISFFAKVWQKIIDFFNNLFGTKKEVEKPVVKPEIVTKQVAKILPTPLITENSPLLKGEKSNYYYDKYLKEQKEQIDITKSKELKELLSICEKISTERKSAFFYLSSAYLNVILKNYDNSLQQIAKAQELLQSPKADEPKDFVERLKNQAIFLELLTRVCKTDKITPEIDDKLAQSLPNLWKNQVANDNYEWQRTLLFYLIAEKYLQNSENVKAALAAYAYKAKYLAANLLDIYSDEKDIAQGITLFQNPQKTAFETYLISNNYLTINMLYDLQATQLCRKGKFVEGLAIMEKIDKSYWKNLKFLL